MQVILKQDVEDLGQAGEVVDVADGYGNNFLVPRGLAMRATKGARKEAEAIARSRAKRDARSREQAETQKAELERTSVVISANADEEGNLYGSVGVTALAKAVREQLGVSVEKKRIELERPLKETGVHEVDVRVHGDVAATLRVEVAPS